ncbi:hypothetical protein BH09PSE3_BH09PSE3_26760 [soil metagenome]
MALCQVLTGKSQAKIHIRLADDRDDLLAESLAVTTVARAAPFTRNKAQCAFGAHAIK